MKHKCLICGEVAEFVEKRRFYCKDCASPWAHRIYRKPTEKEAREILAEDLLASQLVES